MVEETTHIKENKQSDLENKANNLVKETKLLNLARMANILIFLFGQDKAYSRVGEKKDQEIQMEFPSLGGSLKFTLVSNRENFNCQVGTIENPIARIIINVKKENAIKIVSKIIRLPDSLMGLIKILPMYLSRKIIIKGSLMSAITLCKCMMIGKNKIYRRK